MRYRPK